MAKKLSQRVKGHKIKDSMGNCSLNQKIVDLGAFDGVLKNGKFEGYFGQFLFSLREDNDIQ
jgi:hypothetical protein